MHQLGEDLASQDAQAFLTHSKFLNQKFAPQGLDAPALNLPNLAARKLTGRWVPWDWRPLFGPAEALLDEFVAEPDSQQGRCRAGAALCA